MSHIWATNISNFPYSVLNFWYSFTTSVPILLSCSGQKSWYCPPLFISLLNSDLKSPYKSFYFNPFTSLILHFLLPNPSCYVSQTTATFPGVPASIFTLLYHFSFIISALYLSVTSHYIWHIIQILNIVYKASPQLLISNYLLPLFVTLYTPLNFQLAFSSFILWWLYTYSLVYSFRLCLFDSVLIIFQFTAYCNILAENVPDPPK